VNILVTGSSGWLGQTLVPKLVRDGYKVVGLDPEPGATTSVVGSVVDRALVRRVIRDEGITAIIHAAARHKPHIDTYDNSEFVAVWRRRWRRARRSTASSSPRRPRS